MEHKFIDFLKAVLVQEVFNPFPGRQFSLGVLCIDPFLAPAQGRFIVSSLKFTDFRFYIHFGLLEGLQ